MELSLTIKISRNFWLDFNNLNLCTYVQNTQISNIFILCKFNQPPLHN